MLTVIVILIIAFAVVGTLEWAKALYDGIKNKKWLATAVTGLVSLVFAIVLSDGFWNGVKNFFIILASIEIFYVLGFKTIVSLFGIAVAWCKKIVAEVEAYLNPPKTGK